MQQMEYELGRYRKKVEDQQAQIAGLQRQLEDARLGNQEVQGLVDAVLTAVAIQCGEEVCRDDEAGAAGSLGWRLTLPLFSAEDLRGKYEIHAHRDEGNYVLGVIPRQAVE